jgi:Xaa-Pro aminopeptidase
MGGQDQITLLADCVKRSLKGGRGVVGIESGMAPYLPEGNLTQFEYESLRAAWPDASFKNAHAILDELSLIKDAGTINRFREAGRLVDIGHRAVYDAIKHGGYKA